MPLDSAAVPTSILTLETRPWDGAMIVQCKGRLTVEHSEALKNHVRSLLPATRRIIIDLQEITRMDSSGLGAIVGLYISAKKCGCEMILINYNKSIKNLLGLTNLLSVFESCAQSGMRLP
ncbi:MAG TPA: STAS domain-containing protein [Verrucomicrobiae bacterium]|nr:STAS domain-containing protein [Verrucomicrobiae bacterium]